MYYTLSSTSRMDSHFDQQYSTMHTDAIPDSCMWLARGPVGDCRMEAMWYAGRAAALEWVEIVGSRGRRDGDAEASVM